MRDMWIKCEHCGRNIIMRKRNGLFRFRFGKPVIVNPTTGEKKWRKSPTPVDMKIHGSIQMRCIHKDCRQWNTLNYFPNRISPSAEAGTKDIKVANTA